MSGRRQGEERERERGEGKQLGGWERGEVSLGGLAFGEKGQRTKRYRWATLTYCRKAASTSVVTVSSPSLKYLCTTMISQSWTKSFLLFVGDTRN